MKYKFLKISILCCSLFLLCGCTVKTDLIVTSDYKVIESMTVLQKNKVLLKGYNSVKQAVEAYEKSYQDLFDREHYKFSPVIGTIDSGGMIKKTYPSLNSYVRSSNYKSLYETATILNTEQGISFQATGNNYLHALFHEYDITDNADLAIKQVEINIQFHNKVLHHNANDYDGKTNTYTWIFNADSENKYIEFELGKEKKYDVIFQYYLSKYLSVFLISGVLLLITIFTIFYVTRSVKKKNEI